MFRDIFLIPSSGLIKTRMMPDYWVQTASKTCGALYGNKVCCCNVKTLTCAFRHLVGSAKNAIYRVTRQLKSKVWLRNENTRAIQAFKLWRMCNFCRWPSSQKYHQSLRLVIMRYLIQIYSIILDILRYGTIQHQPLLAAVQCDLSNPELHDTEL